MGLIHVISSFGCGVCANKWQINYFFPWCRFDICERKSPKYELLQGFPLTSSWWIDFWPQHVPVFQFAILKKFALRCYLLKPITFLYFHLRSCVRACFFAVNYSTYTKHTSLFDHFIFQFREARWPQKYFGIGFFFFFTALTERDEYGYIFIDQTFTIIFLVFFICNNNVFNNKKYIFLKLFFTCT